MPEQLSVPGGLSVAIIAKNEAHRIEACLNSVAFADQIVVLDSGSTDDTVAIARRLGAEVEETDWPGFGPQKNRALARCRHRWVLSLDADEQLSPALAEEILLVLRAHDGPPAAARRPDPDTHQPSVERADRAGQPAFMQPAAAGAAGRPDAVTAYWLRRSSSFCGQVIRHGLWGNDRVLRLFERTCGRFSDDRVHERLICHGRTQLLDGVLLHDSVDSLDDARCKLLSYSWLGAEKLRDRHAGGVMKAFLHGGWSFVRGYLLRAGFLDGRHGLTLAWLSAQGTYWKYRWAALPEAAWQAKRRIIQRLP